MDISKVKKEELLEKAKALGLEVSEKMTNKEIADLIEKEPQEEPLRSASEEEAEIVIESKALVNVPKRRTSRRSGRSITRFGKSDRIANRTAEDNNIRDLKLSADRHMKKILEGVIDDVRGPFNTADGDVNVLALLMYGTQLVVIPGQEFFSDWENLSKGQKAAFLRERIHQPTKFVVMGKMQIDNQDVWVASHTQAMEKLRKDTWFRTNQNGEYIIKEGDILNGTVTCVLTDSCFIEYGGVEERVFSSELAHEYVLDAKERFSPGDIVQFKVLGIEREKEGSVVKTSFSVKQSIEDPMIKFVDQVKRGDHMGGEVSNVLYFDDRVEIFVNIKNRGVVKCNMGRDAKDPPKQGDLVTLIVVGKSKKGDPRNWVWGEIYKVIPKVPK